ncbi:MAG TPA: hypothetical protein VHM65_08720 [Candidatus Lustribacter sp.]|nr:hypothetical protein [Candidatus Lustribacter sp.]
MVIDPENPYAGQGPVLLDLDDDHGALIVHTPPDLVGAEIELHALDPMVEHTHTGGHPHTHVAEGSPHGHHAPHVAVHPRPMPAGAEMPSAVFVSLAPGRYACSLIVDHVRRLVATVKPGEVTFADWPA